MYKYKQECVYDFPLNKPLISLLSLDAHDTNCGKGELETLHKQVPIMRSGGDSRVLQLATQFPLHTCASHRLYSQVFFSIERTMSIKLTVPTFV